MAWACNPTLACMGDTGALLVIDTVQLQLVPAAQASTKQASMGGLLFGGMVLMTHSVYGCCYFHLIAAAEWVSCSPFCALLSLVSCRLSQLIEFTYFKFLEYCRKGLGCVCFCLSVLCIVCRMLCLVFLRMDCFSILPSTAVPLSLVM